MHLADLYRTFDPTTAECTFLYAPGSFSKIDHTLGHKKSFNKFKKIGIILNVFSEHSGINLELNYRRKTGHFIKMWKLNNPLEKTLCQRLNELENTSRK